MSRSMLKLFFTLCCLSHCAFAQNSLSASPADDLVTGSIKDSVYTNNALGFRLTFPKKMIIDSRTGLNESKEKAAELLKSNGKNGKTVDEMAGQERFAFGMSFPESEKEQNANLVISIAKDLGKGDLDLMVARTIKVVVDSGKMQPENPIGNEIIGGQKFLTFVLGAEMAGMKIHSKGFAMRRNGYLMTISVGYVTEDGLKEMMKILSLMEFF